MVPGGWSTAVVLVVDVGDATIDLALIDGLARLHLLAGRLGWSLCVRNPHHDLCELLELVGLSGVVATEGSDLEPRGEAEGCEQLGVQEVVPRGDAPV